MASPAFPLFRAAFHFNGTTRNLHRCGSFGLRDDLGGVALPAAPCRYQRMATPCGPGPGIRHRSHQRDITFPAPPRYVSNSSVPCRSERRLSCQRRPCLVVYSAAVGTVWSRSGWLVTMLIVWPMVLELFWIFIQSFKTQTSQDNSRVA